MGFALLYKVCILLILLGEVYANQSYNESLTLTPLPTNNLLASFEFQIESLPIKNKNETRKSNQNIKADHYKYFPSHLAPIIESTNTRELHLRFTQGWWDSDSWGKLAFNGHKSGGTGVEIWAVIDASDLDAAKRKWYKLTNSLSGFFCASLNFIDDSITTFPRYSSTDRHSSFLQDEENSLFLFRAALPSEPICTENLTPFLKLLPTRGKAGISSLLDGHKIFDSLWHGMSIDVTTECDSDDCYLELSQSVNAVIDVERSLRKQKDGSIPKPTPGDELVCDMSKIFNIWQCFPSDHQKTVDWNLKTIFGRSIKGSAFSGESTSIRFNVDTDYWNISVSDSRFDDSEVLLLPSLDEMLTYTIDENREYDFHFRSEDSSRTAIIEQQPLLVSRSLTGYSLDQGGFRVSFFNPSDSEAIDFIYFESLPWYMRLYMNSLSMNIKNETGVFELNQDEKVYIKDTFYKTAVDRKRPSHLELSITLPPKTTMTLNYQFDKSLLLYAEYPPDANHGFAIPPAVISILDAKKNNIYEFRTTSLLLGLPTPDFSMPYNVIILTCTVMSLAFGSVFNLLTKKIVTEKEMEELANKGKLKKIISKVKDVMRPN